VSSEHYGTVAGHIADLVAGTYDGQDWPCCGHCEHEPGWEHLGPCMTCHLGLPE